MLLIFSKPIFKDKILEGIKTTTIREDKNCRWKTGMTAQLWLGSPRNTRSKTKPYHFANAVVTKVENIQIHANNKSEISVYYRKNFLFENEYCEKLLEFVQSDGFDSIKEFKEFFETDKIEAYKSYRLITFELTDYHCPFCNDVCSEKNKCTQFANCLNIPLLQ